MIAVLPCNLLAISNVEEIRFPCNLLATYLRNQFTRDAAPELFGTGELYHLKPIFLLNCCESNSSE